jgi:hypothetical protein
VLLVHEGIIHPAFSASALTWFIRYIFHQNLHCLNHGIGDLSRFWLTCLVLFNYLALNILKYKNVFVHVLNIATYMTFLPLVFLGIIQLKN